MAKVLHVLNEVTFSGAEVMLKLAAPDFIKNGFDLHVLSTGERVGAYAEALERAGYKIHHVPFERSLFYFLRLHDFFSAHKFEIVHIHSERAFFGIRC